VGNGRFKKKGRFWEEHHDRSGRKGEHCPDVKKKEALGKYLSKKHESNVRGTWDWLRGIGAPIKSWGGEKRKQAFAEGRGGKDSGPKGLFVGGRTSFEPGRKERGKSPGIKSKENSAKPGARSFCGPS